MNLDPAPLLALAEEVVRRRDRTAALANRPWWDDRVSDGELGEVLGVHRKTVNGWRSGKTRLKFYEADRLACRLGFPPMSVWGFDVWYEAVIDSKFVRRDRTTMELVNAYRSSVAAGTVILRG